MFATTISGLNAFREQLSTISDNIANSETTSYKAGEVSFAEVLNASSSSNSSSSVGNGVAIQNITGDWTQGAISNTGNANDYALTGAGFFVVQDSDGVTSYTRDGQFSYNADGALVNSEAMTVQGYAIDAAGNASNAYSDVIVSNAPLPGTRTTTMGTTINLNSSELVGATSAFSATVEVYDSLGNATPLTINFVKTAANTWSYTPTLPAAVGAVTSGVGALVFNSSGALTTPAADPTITFTLLNGAASPQAVIWDLATAGATNGTLTQYSADSTLTNSTQDGIAPGQLKSISTDNYGIITASYSNGETRSIFQLALADFNCYGGLSKVGNNLYRQTPSSGAPIPGVAGSGKFGILASGSLETSNVDMAKEMSNMILAQRSYESCARMFTTESEMLSTTVNMGK